MTNKPYNRAPFKYRLRYAVAHLMEAAIWLCTPNGSNRLWDWYERSGMTTLDAAVALLYHRRDMNKKIEEKNNANR